MGVTISIINITTMIYFWEYFPFNLPTPFNGEDPLLYYKQLHMTESYSKDSFQLKEI